MFNYQYRYSNCTNHGSIRPYCNMIDVTWKIIQKVLTHSQMSFQSWIISPVRHHIIWCKCLLGQCHTGLQTSVWGCQVPKEGMGPAIYGFSLPGIWHSRAESLFWILDFSHCITHGFIPLPSAVISPSPHLYRTNGWFLPLGNIGAFIASPIFLPDEMKTQPTQSRPQELWHKSVKV